MLTHARPHRQFIIRPSSRSHRVAGGFFTAVLPSIYRQSTAPCTAAGIEVWAAISSSTSRAPAQHTVGGHSLLPALSDQQQRCWWTGLPWSGLSRPRSRSWDHLVQATMGKQSQLMRALRHNDVSAVRTLLQHQSPRSPLSSKQTYIFVLF